jgi:hypothetical protein
MLLLCVAAAMVPASAAAVRAFLARTNFDLANAHDQLGEAPGLLRRREVATGKLGGLDPIAKPLPSQA